MAAMITAEKLLQGYEQGLFPMAEDKDGSDLFWVEPKFRGVLPLDGFHISKSLERAILKNSFRISFDTQFDNVVQGCADRETTWINDEISNLYSDLHQLGFAHSCEVLSNGVLVGGVYGVVLGGAFFGESMFSRQTNASKIALAYLVNRLLNGGFTLFDTQFLTDHLSSLGAIEMSQESYLQLLKPALEISADFDKTRIVPSPQDVIQRKTQIS